MQSILVWSAFSFETWVPLGREGTSLTEPLRAKIQPGKSFGNSMDVTRKATQIGRIQCWVDGAFEIIYLINLLYKPIPGKHIYCLFLLLLHWDYPSSFSHWLLYESLITLFQRPNVLEWPWIEWPWIQGPISSSLKIFIYILIHLYPLSISWKQKANRICPYIIGPSGNLKFLFPKYP